MHPGAAFERRESRDDRGRSSAEVRRIFSTRSLRSRLNDRLARATRYPVTLIVAPAGFGKTVALRDFIETARLDAVRYDVSREDRTLLAFVRGLSTALEPLAPSARAAFPAMQQRVMAAADPLRELADWFAEHLRRVVGDDRDRRLPLRRDRPRRGARC